jgi:hypothetical protein
VVKAHILHNKSSKKNMSLEIFYEKFTEGLLASVNMVIQAQGETSSPDGRLVGTDHSIYSIPATHAKLERKSQLSFLMSAEKQVPDQENCEKMHYNVLPKTGSRALHREVFLIESQN